METALRAMVENLDPWDGLEQDHRHEVLSWIGSGSPLYRTARPATPPRHLVAYSLVVDQPAGEALLVDHRLAGRWLPAGGHVEPGEDPWVTARRELEEELGLDAPFLPPWDRAPFFVTVSTAERPLPAHVDVSLWFAFAGSSDEAADVDDREAAAARWWPLAEIRSGPGTRFDPHLPRAVEKLRAGWRT